MMQRIAAADADRLAKRIVAHHSFPGASHAAIERVLNLGELQQFDHGATLCAEGQPGNDLFFLVRGNISVLRRDGTGTDRVLSDMTCPNVFGHMSVIDGSMRSATCKANGPVEVVILPRQMVDRLITEGSVAGVALRRLLIASLCDQLSQANGFVRKIVLDHSTGSSHTAADAAPAAPPKPRRQAEDLRTLTAALGGWETTLGELESLEQEIEYVMDEDQKRTVDARNRS